MNSNRHVQRAANSPPTNNVSSSRVSALSPKTYLLGRILKDDQTLDSYKIEDGVTVHLVKAKSATAESGAQPTAAPTTSTQPTTAPTS